MCLDLRYFTLLTNRFRNFCNYHQSSLLLEANVNDSYLKISSKFQEIFRNFPVFLFLRSSVVSVI